MKVYMLVEVVLDSLVKTAQSRLWKAGPELYGSEAAYSGVDSQMASVPNEPSMVVMVYVLTKCK